MTNDTQGHSGDAKPSAKDRLLQTIAILGLIAVLLLGAWGIIQLAFNLPGVFSTIGSSISGVFKRNDSVSTQASKETLIVNVPQTITSEQAFTLMWQHNASGGQVGYTVSYSCANNVSIKAPLPNGEYQDVECNTPFNFTNATQRMTLMPSVASNARITFTVSVIKLSNKKVELSGTASANAEPKSATVAKTTTPKSTPTYYTSNTRSTLYGYPDLSVRINSITPASSGYTRRSVVFTIENNGTNAALAGWTFNANLPTNGSYLYQSPLQQPLYPGDKIMYTLTFDSGYYNSSYNYQYPYDNYNSGYGNIGGGYYQDSSYYSGSNYSNYPGRGGVTIAVDPYNQVLESNESNNTASAY